MATMTGDDPQQYATSANLARRGDLHAAFGKIGWFGWIAERMSFRTGDRILDVGAGPGWFWRAMGGTLAKGAALTVLDTSPGMVDEAVNALAPLDGLAGVDGVVADAVDLPFEDGCFDAVVMMHMLYHTRDPAKALAEAHRVLKPGGAVYAAVNAEDDLQEITDIIIDVFGAGPMDYAASQVPLDTAERLVRDQFTDVARHDLTEMYACDDMGVVLAFIKSMPPANRANAVAAKRLHAALARAFDAGRGVLRAGKHSGVVTGVKRAAAQT